MNYAITSNNHWLMLLKIIDTRSFDRLQRHNLAMTPEVSRRYISSSFSIKTYRSTVCSGCFFADVQVLDVSSEIDNRIFFRPEFKSVGRDPDSDFNLCRPNEFGFWKTGIRSSLIRADETKIFSSFCVNFPCVCWLVSEFYPMINTGAREIWRINCAAFIPIKTFRTSQQLRA